jgi:BolA family transcriptional regulator, general stress-responsive regulator
MKAAIAKVLMEALLADYVCIIDDSSKHSGHRTNTVNSHFNVVIVSSQFVEMSLIKRHKSVYSAVDQFIKDGVHALQLSTLTPQEMKARQA